MRLLEGLEPLIILQNLRGGKYLIMDSGCLCISFRLYPVAFSPQIRKKWVDDNHTPPNELLKAK
jgi:hypothetical protein